MSAVLSKLMLLQLKKYSGLEWWRSFLETGSLLVTLAWFDAVT